MATSRLSIGSGWSESSQVSAPVATDVFVTNTNGRPLYYAITGGVSLPDFGPDLSHYVDGWGQFSLQLQAGEVLCLALVDGAGAVTVTTGPSA